MKQILLYSLVPLCLVICFTTGCLSVSSTGTAKSAPKKENAKHIQHNDYKRFVNTWNNSIYEIKDNMNLERAINEPDKYLLKNNYKDIEQKLKILLDFEDKQFSKKLKELQNIKFSKSLYLAAIEWIKMRNRVKYIKLTPTMDSTKLSNAIATMIDDEYFSASTVDKIVQLNDFCYFFEKNKLNLYNQGMSKGITKCTQIQSNLKKNNIILK